MDPASFLLVPRQGPRTAQTVFGGSEPTWNSNESITGSVLNRHGQPKADLARNVSVLGHVEGDVAMDLLSLGMRLGGESSGDLRQAVPRSCQPRGGSMPREGSLSAEQPVLAAR